MICPPLIVFALSRRFPGRLGGDSSKASWNRQLLETAVCLFAIQTCLAPSLAFFPPVVSVPLESLEPELKAKYPNVKNVTFYKGL